MKELAAVEHTAQLNGSSGKTMLGSDTENRNPTAHTHTQTHSSMVKVSLATTEASEANVTQQKNSLEMRVCAKSVR